MPSERFLVRSLTLSPHAVDPLSWFIRPFLPITFAIVMAGVGSVFVVATLPDFDSPVHQSVALLCFVLACLTIHRPVPVVALRAASSPVMAWRGRVWHGSCHQRR
jgi:hypothetical protein